MTPKCFAEILYDTWWTGAVKTKIKLENKYRNNELSYNLNPTLQEDKQLS